MSDLKTQLLLSGLQQILETGTRGHQVFNFLDRHSNHQIRLSEEAQIAFNTLRVFKEGLPPIPEKVIPDRYKSESAAQAASHVGEEAAELAKNIFKAFRFGPYSWNPELPPADQESNLSSILREAQDLVASIQAFKEIVDKEVGRED